MESKLGRDRLTETPQLRIDVGDIETLSGAISSILDIFHVRASISSSSQQSDLIVAREQRCSQEAGCGDRARCGRT